MPPIINNRDQVKFLKKFERRIFWETVRKKSNNIFL